MAEKDLDSRMTEMETEFKNMSKQLDSIASDMKQVLQITAQISVLTERQSTHQSDLTRAFEEIQEVKSRHTEYDKEQDKRIEDIEDNINTIDKESQAWINKIKGGWYVFMLLFVVIQGMMVYGGKLLIDEVKQQHDQLLSISVKIK